MSARLASLARERRAGTDSGFTLPELLVTIVIMAVVVASIAAAMIVSLKTQTAAAGTLDESHDQQRLALWLPRDMESAVQSLVDVQSGTGTGCAGAVPGSSVNLVRFTMVDASSGAVVTYYSSYRVEGTAAPFQLMRYSCRAGQAFARQLMVANLPLASSAAVTIVGAKVTMTVTTVGAGSNGLTFAVSGTARTPVLGGGSNGGTSCVMANGTLNPSSVGLSGTSLSQSVAVSITTTGTCSGLSLVFDPGLGGSRSLTLASGPSTWTATIGAGAYTWTSGLKALVVNGTSNNGTLTLAVGSVCTFQSGNVSPGSSSRNTNGTLTSSLVVTVNTVGCPATPPLTVAVDTGGGLKPAVSLTGGPDTWTVSLANNLYSDWSAGSHPFTVGGIPSASPTLPFTVLGPCTYVSGSASPNPATLGVGGTLASDLVFTVNTTGACTSGITVTVKTGSNPASNQTVLLAETPAGSGVWQGTVTAAQFTSWTAGVGKPVTVINNTTNVGSFTLDVQVGCAFASATTTPNPATVAANGTLTSALGFSVTTSGPCSGLSLSFPTATSDTKTVTLTNSAANTWTASVAAAAYNTWTVGTKAATVTGAAGGSFSFAVQNPPCTYVTGSLTPTTTKIADAAGHLTAGFTVNVTTSGVCSGLTVSLPTTVAGSSVALSGSGSSWTATVGPSDFTWTAGTKTLTVNGTTTTPTLTLTIQPACTATGGAANPSSVYLSVTPGNTLAGPLTLSATTTGTCGALTATFTPGAQGSVQTLPLTESPAGSGNWSLTIAANQFSTWNAGTKPVTINATIPTTYTFVVQTPCTFQSGSASPNPITIAGNNGLLSDVALTVTTTGTCATLTATVPTGGSQTASVTFTQPTAGTWTATIPKQAYTTWTVAPTGGPLTKTATVSGTANAASFTFDVKAVACALSAGSANPATVNRNGNNSLQSDVALSLTTTGTCAGVSVTVATGSSTPTIALAESAPGAGTWSATVLKAAYAWTSGPKSFAVKDSNNNALGTIAMTVNDAPCTFVSGSQTTSGVNVSGGTINKDLVFTVTTTGVCASLTLTVPTGGTQTASTTLTEAAAGSGNWAGMIKKTANSTWTPGTKTATVTTSPNGTFTFTL